MSALSEADVRRIVREEVGAQLLAAARVSSGVVVDADASSFGGPSVEEPCS